MYQPVTSQIVTVTRLLHLTICKVYFQYAESLIGHKTHLSRIIFLGGEGRMRLRKRGVNPSDSQNKIEESPVPILKKSQKKVIYVCIVEEVPLLDSGGFWETFSKGFRDRL